MAAFEGAEAARATATGMAAVTLALIGQLKAGDHVVAAKALFGSCRYVVEDYLPRYGVASTLVDGTDLDAMARRGAAEHQDLLPGNARPIRRSRSSTSRRSPRSRTQAGATLVVDNVFATPLFQSPLALGADCVVYSATKHIDGQGRCLGGVILGSEKFIQKQRPHAAPPDRPVDVAVQCLGAAQGPGDAAGARAPADRQRGDASRSRSPSIRRSRA